VQKHGTVAVVVNISEPLVRWLTDGGWWISSCCSAERRQGSSVWCARCGHSEWSWQQIRGSCSSVHLTRHRLLPSTRLPLLSQNLLRFFGSRGC